MLSFEFAQLNVCANYTEQILVADFYDVLLSSDLDSSAMMHSRDFPYKDVQIVTCTPDKFFEIIIKKKVIFPIRAQVLMIFYKKIRNVMPQGKWGLVN